MTRRAVANPPAIAAATPGLLEQSSAAAPDLAAPAPWSPARRLAFRFCSLYFMLSVLSNPIIGGLLVIPGAYITDLSERWPLRPLTLWTATHVFGITQPLVAYKTGAGDRAFEWVLAFCLLGIATALTALWSILDRRRPHYASLRKWSRLFLRMALASEMLLYGLVKVIPTQMPFPSLTRLLEPYGNFSPMASLWYAVGASPAYEILTGCAETVGGLLLLAPRTATLGALVSLADLIQVFVLNMTYDVPVKLYSFHLILFALFLLAPEARRFFDFFFSRCAVAPSAEPPLFRTRRANRIAVAAQILFGLYPAGTNVQGGIKSWKVRGGGQPRPSLYGIWDVEQMSMDGQLRPPLLTDHDRWRRVIFEAMTLTSFQRMDETFANLPSAVSDANQTLTLTKNDDKNWKATFTFTRPAPDYLILDGAMDGHKLHMELKLFDRNKLPLVSRGFHWINDFPYQR